MKSGLGGVKKPDTVRWQLEKKKGGPRDRPNQKSDAQEFELRVLKFPPDSGGKADQADAQNDKKYRFGNLGPMR